MKGHLVMAALAAVVAVPASAALVQVDIVGAVEFNQANPNRNPELATVQVGEIATYSFQLDTDLFVDSGSFNVRGYEIDQSSFSVTMSGGWSTTLASPFPGGLTPYFVLRDNDPVADGFYLTYGGVDFPGGLPTAEPGIFDPFEAAFEVGYDGGTLNSLNLADAVGTYEYGSGGPGTLTNFYFNLVDAGFEVVGIDFQSLTISTVPAPSALAVVLLSGLARRRRRA